MPIFISLFFWFFMNSYKFGNFQKCRYFFPCQEIKLQGNAKKSAVICPIPTFVVVDDVNALQSHMIVFFETELAYTSKCHFYYEENQSKQKIYQEKKKKNKIV
jgi:hypothetical protein